ncbi:hypothetical protein V6N12_005009 [Hibiscus sabdariffa]|uniref:Uncharacterized protein n=1 Tax=Hibiscus sabdariffa TaxID=183260 RepID=A0ABR2CN74_9ROSI
MGSDPLITYVDPYWQEVLGYPSVDDMIEVSGVWDRDSFSALLPLDIIHKVTALHGILPSAGSDMVGWNVGKDRQFTVKSAYSVRYGPSIPEHDGLWKRINKFRGLQRVNVFLWVYDSSRNFRSQPVYFPSGLPELNRYSMNFLFGAFKPACNILITFSDAKTRKQVPMKKENGQTVMVPLFQSQENIAGKISIEPLQGQKIEHNGVKVELLGQIEMYFDRGNFYDFTSLVRELDVPGDIYERKTYPFEFSTVEMPYETYSGVNVRLRYVLKVTVSRNYGGSIVEYHDFMVRNYAPPPSINNSIKMEVGIEDCLHIEFEYNKSKYHLKDVIIGKIYFLLVRIKIKNMDLEIRRRESTGSGANTHVETETLAKYELMDGAPVRGESIPIRLFLSPYELTPTHRNVNNKFSVKYYLNLVLVDEEDRRYFKQQEITMYRLQDS